MDNKQGLRQVNHYAYYTSATRENFKPDGFNFDVNMFENLIDCWTPKKDFPIILRSPISKIDEFCKIVYNMNFDETYNFLSGITDAFMRKTFKNLASQGNSFSQSLVSKHFMGLRDDVDKDSNVNITIVNDLQEED